MMQIYESTGSWRLTKPIPKPSMNVDNYLREKIMEKIKTSLNDDELRPWHNAINTLCRMFARWKEWQDTIDFILTHEYTPKDEGMKHLLACYYRWTDQPMLTTSDGQSIRHRNICWRHATDSGSALQIAYTGGVRPAADVDESNNPIPYHWCPSFYCRVDGQNIGVTLQKENYVKISLSTIEHARKYTKNQLRPFIFHGTAKCRKININAL